MSTAERKDAPFMVVLKAAVREKELGKEQFQVLHSFRFMFKKKLLKDIFFYFIFFQFDFKYFHLKKLLNNSYKSIYINWCCRISKSSVQNNQFICSFGRLQSQAVSYLQLM